MPETAADTPSTAHKTDVERSAIGRALGYARAYGGAIATFLAAVGVLDQGIAHYASADWLPLPWRPVAIGGGLLLPALALMWQQQVKPRPAALVVFERAKPGYFRTGPYEDITRDRQDFRRADNAHERVLDWLLGKPGVPLYLIGESGAGKSSLLQAFVLPELQKQGWTVVPVRALEDPEASLRAALGATGPEPDTLTLIERAARKARAGPLLILIDQAEEFLTLPGGAAAEAVARFRGLVDALAAAVSKKGACKELRLLLALRSNYASQIEALGLPPRHHGANMWEVGPFDWAAAHRFMADSGLGLGEQDIERLLQGTAVLEEGRRRLIRPVTLNLLGFILATGQAVWREEGDAGELIRGYIRQSLRQPAIRDVAPRLLPGLVTAAGTKRARPLAELALEAGLEQGQTRDVLLTLQRAGLVRPLGQSPERWEVSHDFIARLLEHELPRRRSWIGWSRSDRSEDAKALQAAADVQARAALNDLGLALRQEEHGLVLNAFGQVTDGDLARAQSYLQHFAERIVAARLSGARIGNLHPLSGLKQLQSLDLRSTQVVDLSPLSGLAQLRILRGVDAVSQQVGRLRQQRRAGRLPDLSF